MGLTEGNNFLIEFWEEGVEQAKEYIVLDKEWIATLNRIREEYPNNWRIVEACRELIFYYTKEIQEEAQEIEDLRKAISQLS